MPGQNIMILKYTIAWIPMVFIAMANGAIRQLGYGKLLGELSAHQLSCLTGIMLFLLYPPVALSRLGGNTSKAL
jgi:hypothetical protein